LQQKQTIMFRSIKHIEEVMRLNMEHEIYVIQALFMLMVIIQKPNLMHFSRNELAAICTSGCHFPALFQIILQGLMYCRQ
jgi:hypothetical protein